MTEDELMTELAKMIRAEEIVDPRLESLLRGRATDEDLRALRASARTDAELARRIEAFEPLSEEALAKLDALAAPKRSGRLLRWGAGAGALAALAAGVVLSLPPASLPEYAFDVRAGDALRRSGERSTEGVRRMRADSTLEMVLRPNASVEGTVVGRAFVRVHARDQIFERPVEVFDGAVRLTGTAEAVTGLSEGSATVVLIVGRPGSVPDVTTVRAISTLHRVRMEGRGYRAARIDVQIHPTPSTP